MIVLNSAAWRKVKWGRAAMLFPVQILAFSFYLCTAAAQAGEVPIAVNNGGFESGDTSGWAVFNPDAEPITFAVTSNTNSVFEGNVSALVQVPSGASSRVALKNRIDISSLNAGSFVKVSCHLRSHNMNLYDSSKGIFPIVRIIGTDGSILLFSGKKSSLIGTQWYLPWETLVTVPEGAQYLDFLLAFDTGMSSGWVFIDQLEVFQLSGLSTPTSLPDVEVAVDSNDVPRIYVDNEKIIPTMFMTVVGDVGKAYSEIDRAVDNGVEIYQVLLNLPWAGCNLGMVDQILAKKPDAKIVLRINLDAMGDGFSAAYANDLMLDQDGAVVTNKFGGTSVSLASSSFVGSYKLQLDYLLKYIYNHDKYRNCVIGVMFGRLLTEWFTPLMGFNYVDYSEVNRIGFENYVGDKYGWNVAAINSKWGTSYTSCDQIAIPEPEEFESADVGLFRNPSNHCMLVDYGVYYNQMTAQRINELCKKYKTVTGGKGVAGACYGYLNELTTSGQGIIHSGHLALKWVLYSPDVDFVASPLGYHHRADGEALSFHGMIDSITANGKIAFQEDDSRTYLWSDNESYEYPTLDATENALKRNYGNILCHNQGSWWLDLAGQGAFDSDEIWDVNSLSLYVNSLELNSPSYTPDVALVFDEDSFFYMKTDAMQKRLALQLHCELRNQFQQAGLRVGYYLLDDFGKIPVTTKMIVFVNCHKLNDTDRSRINGYKCMQRSMVWLYATGYLSDDAMGVEQLEEVTGFPLLINTNEISPYVNVVNSGHVLTDGIAGYRFGGETGTVSPTFYGSAAVGGYTVLAEYDDGKDGILLEDHGTWKSIFCGAPYLTTKIIRRLAEYSGIRLMINPGDDSAEDAVNCNGSVMYVYARNAAGTRTLQLPDGYEASDIYEVTTEQDTLIAMNVTGWQSYFEKDECKIFLIY